MSLHKTAELPPDRNYVLGFLPHGIISYSAFVTFATEALDVSKTFPGGSWWGTTLWHRHARSHSCQHTAVLHIRCRCRCR